MHYEAYNYIDLADIFDHAEECTYFTNRSEWVHLPCERVYFICDKNTKFAMIMSKSIKDLSIHEIEEIDKSGYYFFIMEKQRNH